jgi:hypothetical protein
MWKRSDGTAVETPPVLFPGDVRRAVPIGRFLGSRHVMHQGIPIPRPQCHNAMISLKLVGLEGLEPSTKGFTIPCTRCHCVGKPKNPNAFPMAPFRGD